MDNRHLMEYVQEFEDFEKERGEEHIFSEEDVEAIYKLGACKHPPFGSYSNCIRLALCIGFVNGYKAGEARKL